MAQALHAVCGKWGCDVVALRLRRHSLGRRYIYPSSNEAVLIWSWDGVTAAPWVSAPTAHTAGRPQTGFKNTHTQKTPGYPDDTFFPKMTVRKRVPETSVFIKQITKQIQHHMVVKPDQEGRVTHQQASCLLRKLQLVQGGTGAQCNVQYTTAIYDINIQCTLQVKRFCTPQV